VKHIGEPSPGMERPCPLSAATAALLRGILRDEGQAQDGEVACPTKLPTSVGLRIKNQFLGTGAVPSHRSSVL
jgi:hypothetical protein